MKIRTTLVAGFCFCSSSSQVGGVIEIMQKTESPAHVFWGWVLGSIVLASGVVFLIGVAENWDKLGALDEPPPVEPVRRDNLPVLMGTGAVMLDPGTVPSNSPNQGEPSND
jgi:hypothetical protein